MSSIPVDPPGLSNLILLEYDERVVVVPRPSSREVRAQVIGVKLV